MRRGVLFLCTGNACRSQMAEGFAAQLFPSGIRVFSAGTRPKGLDPRAVRAMHELGLDISRHRSKALDEIAKDEISLIVTLCGDAAQSCPSLPGVRHVHWPLSDPAQATGTEAEVLGAFRSIRDDLARRVSDLAATFAAEPAIGEGRP